MTEDISWLVSIEGLKILSVAVIGIILYRILVVLGKIWREK